MNGIDRFPIRLMNEFDRFVATFPPATPLLPLFHVCDALGFRGIQKEETLKTNNCTVFQQDLLYFFYGRPSYRIRGHGVPTSNPSLLPVCFVLDFEKIGPPHHVYPFDSGAAHANMFVDFFPDECGNADFALTPNCEAPARIVSCFYETNWRYFLEEGAAREIKAMDIEAQVYQNLLENKGDTKYDNRRSTVEVAYAAHVPLTKENFLAIVIPITMLNDQRVTDFIASYNAKTLTYITSHENPGGYHAAIKTKVYDFLMDHNYIQP